jgi:hypothetical protein
MRLRFHHLFVLEEVSDEFLPWILFVVIPAQQHLRFDSHQGRRQHKELTGDVDIVPFHQVEVTQIIPCYFGNWDIVDVEIVPLDQIQDHPERRLDAVELCLVVAVVGIAQNCCLVMGPEGNFPRY